MKKIYTLILPATLILLFTTGCSKDFLKRYEKRIVGGTWQLVDVNGNGLGRSYHSDFVNGSFTFYDNGTVEYTTPSGVYYEGRWNIRRETAYDDSQMKVLKITVSNFQSQRILSEYFEDMRFTDTDRFVAYVYTTGRTTKFIFKR